MKNKLFVAGLPEAITHDILRQLFEATGAVVADLHIPRDRASGRSRKFAFVTLATAADAEMARMALDGSLQGGRVMSVRLWRDATPPAKPLAGYRVTVAPEDAARVEHLLNAARSVDIITSWQEVRVFSWSGTPDASMRELRRAIGEVVSDDDE